MSCPIKLCNNVCSIRRHWLFILFTLLAISVAVFHVNHKLFFTINSMHVILSDRVWLALNFIVAPKHFILSIILLLATLLFKRDKLSRVIVLLILYYAIFFALKKFFGEPRPYVVLPVGSFHWLSHAEQSVGKAYASFPSGHAGIAAVFVFTLIRLFFEKQKLIKLVLFIFLVLACMARVCTGWHWPLDVIVSGLISYVLVQVCFCGSWLPAGGEF